MNLAEPGAFPAVFVRDMTVAYADRPVLWDVDWDVPVGALMAIVGPNGAGKSTLIKSVLELVPVSAGTVRIFGEPYVRNRSAVGYLPQRGSVDWDFPTDVLDVVMMGMYGQIGWFRRPKAQHRERAMECLEKVSMADLAKRQISELSGGQQQRVFLARALAQDPKIYFMDEPFVGVDAVTEQALVLVMKELQAAGKTVIVVHHDLETVPVYFDHVTLLNVKMIASGRCDQVFTAENLRATYGGAVSLIAP